MRITDAFTRLLDPTNAVYVTGSEEDRKQARDEWHRHRWTAEVMSSPLEELPRSDLEFHRFQVVEHVPSGRRYRPRLDRPIGLENALAYYCDSTGLPVLLEAAPGAATRAEAEQRRAEREQRKGMPRSKPSWMTR